MALDRTPPPDVREALRKEVGFGCPICRSPFLTYHHFNPPWREKEHHEPKGMIALCAKHHDSADRNTYSVEYLDRLKKGTIPLQRSRSFFLGREGSLGTSRQLLRWRHQCYHARPLRSDRHSGEGQGWVAPDVTLPSGGGRAALDFDGSQRVDWEPYPDS